MKDHLNFGAWVVAGAAAIGLAMLCGVPEFMRMSLAHGDLLDWVMGALCLIWLLIILKVPWDLYFQAREVDFELQRSQELKIAIVEGRPAYIRTLQRRLGLLAVGAHLLSALFVAGVAYFTHGIVGYYFAVFYLVSTLFRPAIAGYVYLSRKLKAIGQEARYPREDVVELRGRVQEQTARMKQAQQRLDELSVQLQRESGARESEVKELRQNLRTVGLEMERSISRLTDNQDVIKGIQAFVRLVTQAQ
jgi:hypothetical protein